MQPARVVGRVKVGRHTPAVVSAAAAGTVMNAACDTGSR